MPFDAFTIKHTIKELQFLVGGKINKINQPNKEDVIFSVYAGGKTQKIILSTHAQNARIGLTNQEKENPAVCPNFCMLLRKHLTGAEITGVDVAFNDRIIAVTLTNKTELLDDKTFTIYAEIMGKHSNVFLVEKACFRSVFVFTKPFIF